MPGLTDRWQEGRGVEPLIRTLTGPLLAVSVFEHTLTCHPITWQEGRGIEPLIRTLTSPLLVVSVSELTLTCLPIVLDEITGIARSRHPVKVYCYQWTTSNYSKERASDHLAIQQFTKVHSGCSPSLSYSITASLPCQQFSQTFSSLPHRKIQRLH